MLERNWRCRLGEIDLICAQGPTLVVCEVKARTGSSHGYPFEAVTAPSSAGLRRLAAAYLRQQESRWPRSASTWPASWTGPSRSSKVRSEARGIGSVPMETLIVERKDGVVTVTMNRPERKNAAQRPDADRATQHLHGGRGQPG